MGGGGQGRRASRPCLPWRAEVTLSLSLPSPSLTALFSASLASVPHTLVLEAGSCKWGRLSALPAFCLPACSLSYLPAAVSKGGGPQPWGTGRPSVNQEKG